MNENNNETINSLNDDKLVRPADDASPEEVSEYLSKLESLNKQLYVRTKKAEGFELIDGKWVKPEPKDEKPKPKESKNEDGLNQKDLITLMKSNIDEDDVEEVLNYAKFRNISVKDALESDVVKTLLNVKKEQRATAQATHTGTSAKSTTKLTDDELMINAKKGILPTNDEDMQRLARLSLKRR